MSNHTGEPSDFAMLAGVRKIPTAITSPTISAVAVRRPICLLSLSWAIRRVSGSVWVLQTKRPRTFEFREPKKFERYGRSQVSFSVSVPVWEGDPDWKKRYLRTSLGLQQVWKEPVLMGTNPGQICPATWAKIPPARIHVTSLTIEIHLQLKLEMQS